MMTETRLSHAGLYQCQRKQVFSHEYRTTLFTSTDGHSGICGFQSLQVRLLSCNKQAFNVQKMLLPNGDDPTKDLKNSVRTTVQLLYQLSYIRLYLMVGIEPTTH